MSAGTVPAVQPPKSPATTTNWAPSAKVTTGVLAGAVTMLIFEFVPHASTWTPATAAAITQIVTFVVQYMVPERQ